MVLIDPGALGGIHVRGPSDDIRRSIVDRLANMAPGSVLSVPVGIDESALNGGFDAFASLAAGEPVYNQGLFARARGGGLILKMAERQSVAAIAALVHPSKTHSDIDTGEEASAEYRYPPAIIALDEGEPTGEALHPMLAEKLAFTLTTHGIRSVPDGDALYAVEDITSARREINRTQLDEAHVAEVIASCEQLGIDGAAPPFFVLRAARGIAALEGRGSVETADIVRAGTLVLSSRATRALPDEPAASEPEQQNPPETPEPPQEQQPQGGSENVQENDDVSSPPQTDEGDLQEILVQTISSGSVTGALESLAFLKKNRPKGRSEAGRSGERIRQLSRGRVVGVRRDNPKRTGARLDVPATLRAAAPWSRLRQEQIDNLVTNKSPNGANVTSTIGKRPLVKLRPSDFHVKVCEQKRGSSVIFVIDASGSSAMLRLNEAKGAVEALLADCYVRRDMVSAIVCRGDGAFVALPPTNSLSLAKRVLANTSGGGGTPLASAFKVARDLALKEKMKGRSPMIVVLSDGRANVTESGTGGRAEAMEQAKDRASEIADSEVPSIFFDTGRRPGDAAASLSAALCAEYQPLPSADPQKIRRRVKEVQV
ncbi:MAG: VWA domain-containing protein [Pseudomonadota bacterium]